jgi:hypothetical protein
MNMTRPLLVWEDTSPDSRKKLFRLFGVSWEATRYAWLSPLSWCALGVAVALAENAAHTTARVGAHGILYGVALLVTNVLHTVGHIAFARMAGAPMAANILTSTRDVNVYVQPGSSAPPTSRVVRALGGPVANLLVGAAAVLGSRFVVVRWLLLFGYFNLAIGAWTLAPVPSLDGWVLWTAFRRARRSTQPD